MRDDVDMGILLIEPDVSFDDVKGLEEVKLALRRVALSIKLSFEHPELFFFSIKHANILLYGPSGTGKTLLALAMAKECGAKFIPIDCEYLLNECTVFSCVRGEDRVKTVFSKAVKNTPCVIFFDAIDAISFREGFKIDPIGSLTPARLQLMKELDEPRNGIISIAATNRIELVEGIVLRKFLHRLEVGLPNDEARREIIKVYFKKYLENLKKKVEVEEKEGVIEWLVRETEGLSGGEIKEVCLGALKDALYYEFIERTGNVIIRRYHFETALSGLKKDIEEGNGPIHIYISPYIGDL